MPRKKKIAQVTVDGVTMNVADVPSPTDNGHHGDEALETLPFTNLFPAAAKDEPKPYVEPAAILRTNVKGQSQDVVLAACNLITGENRHGKTAILDAVRLALTGKHPVGPHGKDLMELAPAGAQGLYAELEAPSWGSKFALVAGKKPAPLEVKGVPADSEERIMPALAMRSFLVGDKLAREAVFKRFGQVAMTGGVPTPKGLNTDQKALWAKGAVACTDPDPAKVLSKISAWMRSEKLACGKTVSSLTTQLEEARARLAELSAGAERIPLLEEQYKKAVAWESLASTREQLADAKAKLEALAAEAQVFVEGQAAFDATWTAAVEQRGKIEAEIAAKKAAWQALHGQRKELAPRLERIRAMDDVLAAMEKAQSKACPLCRGPADPTAIRREIQALLDERKTQDKTFETGMGKVEEEIARLANDVRGIEGNERVAKVSRDRQRESIKMAAGIARARVESLEASIAAVGASYDGPTPDALRAEIDGLRNAESTRVQVEALEEQIRGAKNEQIVAKALEGEAEKMLQTLLTSAAVNAETAVQKYLPVSFTAVLDLSDGGCEWRLMGADGRPHNRFAMSGAEQTALMVALALAWTEGSKIRVLTLDDADIGPLDDKNLTLFLNKIRDCVEAGLLTQVFVATPRRPPAELKGWNEISR